jgi:UDP-N-acetyl-D-mannosaminuronic acid dehydrogenase
MKVQIIGLGYIGLPTAAIIAQRGIDVQGVDINLSVIETIKRGDIHINEPGIGTRVKQSVNAGFLHVSTTPKEADVHVIAVPTPFKENFEPDTSFVESATRSIIPLLKKGDTFIIESTSPIGTTERMSELIFQMRHELKNAIFIAYCPERVLPGNTLMELMNNDRIIGGLDDQSTEKATDFYKIFVTGEIHKTNARTAEMCKLVENSSRDVQIAFANEVSLICDKANINVWELIRLANKHPRVNILQPGSGVGGHCIAVDPYFIVSDFPIESRLINSAREINNYKALWCADKIQKARAQFKQAHAREPFIALMGLSFKPNIDDLRESPAKYIAQKILQSMNNQVLIVEPNIREHDEFILTEYQNAYEKADIVAFLVAHDEFKKLKYREDKVILDFCGIFKKQ